MAIQLPLTAFKRVPYEADVAILGPNLTGSAFVMHLRNNPGDTGPTLVTLSNAAAGLQGISVTYNASYSYIDASGATVTAAASVIKILIDEATLEALSLANPTNCDLKLSYDMHMTPTAQLKRVLMFGEFLIKPGVTI